MAVSGDTCIDINDIILFFQGTSIPVYRFNITEFFRCTLRSWLMVSTMWGLRNKFHLLNFSNNL